MGGDEPGLKVSKCGTKGKGLVATRSFEKDEFVCNYRGEHISYKLGNERFELYSEDNNFLFYNKCNDIPSYIDGTNTQCYGRFINHSNYPNVKPKVIYHEGQPRIYFTAKHKIEVGCEIEFDYGEHNPKALQQCSFLRKKKRSNSI